MNRFLLTKTKEHYDIKLTVERSCRNVPFPIYSSKHMVCGGTIIGSGRKISECVMESKTKGTFRKRQVDFKTFIRIESNRHFLKGTDA